MMPPSGSVRWNHFHSALQLAIQRSAHKWTFDDFAECFSLYVEEEPAGASAIFHDISQHMEAQISSDIEAIFNEYAVKETIDRLHTVVTEAKQRKAAGVVTRDVWREDSNPRASTRARVIPQLTNERDRLRKILSELQRENFTLQERLASEIAERKSIDGQVTQILDCLDKVHDKWMSLPTDEIDGWTVQTAESTIHPTHS